MEVIRVILNMEKETKSGMKPSNVLSGKEEAQQQDRKSPFNGSSNTLKNKNEEQQILPSFSLMKKVCLKLCFITAGSFLKMQE